jgi:N12 class adenine-specific DNA methylase
MVLGEHALRCGVYGPKPAYTCRPRHGDPPLEDMLDTALAHLPANILTPMPRLSAKADANEDADAVHAGTAAKPAPAKARGAAIKEGSYFVGKAGRLLKIVSRSAVAVPVKKLQSEDGITAKAARIIRALIPIRDAVRAVLRAQMTDRPWADAQIRLHVAYQAFICVSSDLT